MQKHSFVGLQNLVGREMSSWDANNDEKWCLGPQKFESWEIVFWDTRKELYFQRKNCAGTFSGWECYFVGLQNFETSYFSTKRTWL